MVHNLIIYYLNVYVLVARIVDEEGKSFFKLWINGCVTSLKRRRKNVTYDKKINKTYQENFKWLSQEMYLALSSDVLHR